MDPFDPSVAATAYDAVAADYDATFGDDLDRLPVDRSVLDLTAERVAGVGPLVDLGCGVGQVARYISDRGVPVVGLDVASRMLDLARIRAQHCSFLRGDIGTLPFAPGSLGGAVAFYVIQHVARQSLPCVLAECARVIASGGILTVAAHLGTGEVTVEEFLGHGVEPFGGTFFAEHEVRSALKTAGFRADEIRTRDPLPHEYPSRRLYVLSSRRG